MKSKISDWNELYKKEKTENLPWFSLKLDHDLNDALNIIKKGKILSIGEGPGTQAIALAKKGYSVTATDISEAAITKAKERTKNEQTQPMSHSVQTHRASNSLNAEIDFIVDDIVKTKLKEKFPAIFDRGCFHVLEPGKRQKYVKNVHKLLGDNGVLFLKTFSKKETMQGGPHRFTKDGLKEIFGKHFDVLSVKETYFESTLENNPKALFAVMKKKGVAIL